MEAGSNIGGLPAKVPAERRRKLVRWRMSRLISVTPPAHHSFAGGLVSNRPQASNLKPLFFGNKPGLLVSYHASVSRIACGLPTVFDVGTLNQMQS